MGNASEDAADTGGMRVGDGGKDGRISTELGRREVRPKIAVDPPGVTVDDGPSPFARILRGLGQEVDRGEATVRRAVDGGKGGELGHLDLLALQAGVYRYSEAVDLSAKLVDRATSGVKTVLQGQ